MNRDLQRELAFIVEKVQQVGQTQLSRRQDITVEYKAHRNDLLTNIDVSSERELVSAIRGRWPHDGFLAEEEHTSGSDAEWCWVIDPIDGTRNYVSGSGPWSISIALEHRGIALLGVVHDPLHAETFTALRGSGAQLNATSLRVATSGALGSALLGATFETSEAGRSTASRLLSAFLPRVGDVRRLPAALNLSYAAAGRVDIGFVVGGRAWDVRAGELIAAEAGLEVRTREHEGSTLTLVSPPVLSEGFLHMVESSS
ncbi:inositol monophosphatase [Nocardioides immobilis]|uniref:Inositol monophosphatase n=1 Tax=Nocardioides immobilis TaxID=2049295 RepID=A0A417Y991_9ACTN|nr:inositol monophosphatase family protein [Nocardioides immobilis]RHW29175.1 inositol monophosphatase [Nocardioides immobilis]